MVKLQIIFSFITVFLYIFYIKHVLHLYFKNRKKFLGKLTRRGIRDLTEVKKGHRQACATSSICRQGLGDFILYMIFYLEHNMF